MSQAAYREEDLLWKAELDVLEGDHSDEKDADVRCMSRVNQIVS